MAFDLIQMPSKYLDNKEDQFSWRLLVFTLNSQSKQSAVLGRHSTCDFLINAPKLPCFLSRKHAVLRINKHTLYVKDLKSTNGTFKNNIMLKPNVEYALRDGDLVAFGCKSEKRPSPGTAVNQNDTPFLFRVIKSKSNKSTTNNAETVNEKNPDSAENTDADETSKVITAPSSNPRVQSEQAKISTKELPSTTPSVSIQPMKRKPSSSKTSKKGKKKVKVQGATLTSADGVDAGDQCSSFDCKALLHTDDVLNWVQCDACDKWFHTVCVGCNYDEVKNQNRQFYCSFCDPDDDK